MASVGLDDCGLRPILETNVARSVKNCSLHSLLYLLQRMTKPPSTEMD